MLMRSAMGGEKQPGIFLLHIFLPDGLGWIPATEVGKKMGAEKSPSLGRQKSLVACAPTSRVRFARMIDGSAIHSLTYREQNRSA